MDNLLDANHDVNRVVAAGRCDRIRLSLRCADRDAVGLKPGKDRGANVLGRSLEPCGYGNIYCARQFSRAQHPQLPIRTLIRGRMDRALAP